MEKLIITIARQYGSGGRTVGKMLAERLQIPYYDREIISMASEDSGINAALFQDEKKVHSLRALLTGITAISCSPRKAPASQKTITCSPTRPRLSASWQKKVPAS